MGRSLCAPTNSMSHEPYDICLSLSLTNRLSLTLFFCGKAEWRSSECNLNLIWGHNLIAQATIEESQDCSFNWGFCTVRLSAMWFCAPSPHSTSPLNCNLKLFLIRETMVQLGEVKARPTSIFQLVWTWFLKYFPIFIREWGGWCISQLSLQVVCIDPKTGYEPVLLREVRF